MTSKINIIKFFVAFFSFYFLTGIISIFKAYGQATKIEIEFKENEVFEKLVSKNISSFFESTNSAFNKKKNPKFKSEIITTSALESVLKMWSLSPFKFVVQPLFGQLIKKPQGGFEIRNIPIFVMNASVENKSQELVIHINKIGIIEDVFVSLGSDISKQLVELGDSDRDLRNRQIILDYIENFKTAYYRGDLKFIESVFNIENSGDFLQTKKGSEMLQHKKESMIKLRQIMAANNYINVKFDSVQIKRHGRYLNTYGVDMMQAWNTPIYNDEGFLFLVIVILEENRPLIHLSTWQKPPTGKKSITQTEKFKLSDFKIN